MKNNYVALFSFFICFHVYAGETSIDCDKAISTYDLGQCALKEVEQAEQQLEKYLAEALVFNQEDKELVASIKVAQEKWQVYAKSHCDSVYTQYRQGSIRGMMALDCKKMLIKRRTHDIWSNFLTYMDSSPPVLPEPK
ncbi:hypothetical protein CS022_10765 [Veronia nyctiphanis]|uniref:Lysozyme inhibitor LprI-like N-terminal domain-containing protein n=1 Tax=Veronia nyctiphanis TaxID=1278244 RepID=A0A4Q0YRL4_9GAMM|nr:lysozyme inhibitor LprI family protein [Veronia nyctiphanis]RXJ73285.1 hypothetical protein CS022_10765 [Veronia nyctiphanis]